MQTLRQGMKGADVRRWQLFLTGQKLQPGPADGDFGPQTHKATLEFQARHRLLPDGIVGLKTLGQAMLLGFPTLSDRKDVSHAGPNWPPRPDFAALSGTAPRQRVFGAFAYTVAPLPGNPENIRIVGDWEERNIVRVTIPQLRGVPGAPRDGSVRFHRLAARQLQALWRAWESKGLLSRVLTWDGAFTARFVRGSRSVLSNHSFGSAFDINAGWNALGTRPALSGTHGSVRELVPLANAHGFYWGGHFQNRPDGMHFEIAFLK